jgi:hypothetical protein
MDKTLSGLLMVCLCLPTTTFAQLPVARGGAMNPVLTSGDSGALASLQAATSDVAGLQSAARVHDLVEKIGVGKKVRLLTVAGEDVRGRIGSIGDDSFTVDSGQRRVISYADVSAMKRQGMNGWLKAGIIAGAAFGGLMLATGICYWSGSCVS